MVKNNISEKVIMPGYEMILNLFSCIDVYIQPSISKDTSPISLIHSFASGILHYPESILEIKQLKLNNLRLGGSYADKTI